MAERARNVFNYAVGSNCTYVANAYPKAKYVWLMFHNKNNLTLNKIILSGSPTNYDVKFSADIELEKVTEKVRVPFKDFHKKQRNTVYEYITIMAKNKDGDDAVICDNYEIGANRSFIITKEGGIKPQEYGGDLWVDEFGVNHKP